MGNKRFVFILIAVPLLIIIGVAVYFFAGQLSRKKQTPPSPAAPPARVSLLVGNPVISPVLSFNGQTVWYLTADGQMFRKAIDGSGNPEAFPLPSAIANPVRTFWSQNNGDFIVEQNLNGHSQYQYFDSTGKAFTTYDPRLRNPRILPGGNKIVYNWGTGTTQNQLVVADSSGANYKKVVDLPAGSFLLEASPTRQQAAVYDASATSTAKLALVDLFTGQFLNLGTAAGYEGVRFSPDGNKLLAARNDVAAGGAPHLLVFDTETAALKDLGILSKIEQTGWTADSRDIIIATASGFVKYDLATDQQSDIYKFGNQENYQPRDLFVHPTQPYLFFVDDKTGNLYRLSMQ